MIAAGIALALIAAAGLLLVRLLAGPTLHDRALAAHGIVLLGALICAALGVLAQRPGWTDAAVAFVFADFVMVTCILKVFRARSLQSALAKPEAQ